MQRGHFAVTKARQLRARPEALANSTLPGAGGQKHLLGSIPRFRRRNHVDAFWLALFEEVGRSTCPRRAADRFIDLAHRIGKSLELGIASARGGILKTGERLCRRWLRCVWRSARGSSPLRRSRLRSPVEYGLPAIHRRVALLSLPRHC
jgi:hypothetical protein